MSLIIKNKLDVVKSLQHLEYSYQKIKEWDFSRTDWIEEELESLESFASRFARSTDLIISRLLRSLAKQIDPAFRGSVIDTLNLAEKENWISSSRTWYRIRELRNIAAHEYTTEDFNKLLVELISLIPTVLQIKKML